MKPNTYDETLRVKVHTVEELQAALEQAVTACNQHPSVINIPSQDMILEAECLSDGSIVYNLSVEH